MADYIITNPQGQKFKITAPDGATQDQVLAYAKQQFAQQPKAPTTAQEMQKPTGFQKFAVPVGAALTDTGRALENLASYAVNPQQGIVSTLLNEQKSASEQPARDAFKAQHPSLYYGLYAPTSILSMTPLGEGVAGAASEGASALLPQGAGLMQRALLRAGQSAATGAAYGAQMPGDTAKNIAFGAATGPIADFGLQGIGKAIGKGLSLGGKGASQVSDLASKMFMPQRTAANTVSKIIQESKTAPLAVGAPSIPGVQLSAGGATLDPGIQSLEQAVRSRNVGGLSNEALFQHQARQNMGNLADKLGSMGNLDTSLEEASSKGAAALQAAKDALNQHEANLWGNVPENTPVNIDQTLASIDRWISRMPKVDQAVLMEHAGKPLSILRDVALKYGSPEADSIMVPFSEMKGFRAMLGATKRRLGDKFSPTADQNAARLIGKLDDKVLSALGNENAFAKGIQDLGESYNAARNFTSDIYNKYLTKPVRKMLFTDPAKTLQNATATPENLKAYLNATSQAPDGGAAAQQAVRDYLLKKITGSVSMSSRGGQMGDAFLNGQKLNKVLDEHRNLLSQVFHPEELKTMQNVAGDAYRTLASESASPRVGSNTVQKYLSNQAVAGKLGQANAPGWVGSAVGSVRNALIGRYQGATDKLLRDTLLNSSDPEVQKILEAPASQQNISKAMQLMGRIQAAKGRAIKAAPLSTGALRHLPITGSTWLTTQKIAQ